jgi:AraC-like DNA-binding protein
MLGYGLMSQSSLRDVFRFADRFGSILRMPAWNLCFFTNETHAVMEGREAVSHGSLRRFSCEQLLISVSTILRNLLPPNPHMELLFDYPEPEYHSRYRDRLPNVRFSTAVTQIRVPIELFDQPLKTADTVSAKLAERECERELTLLGHNRDIANQVRAVLVNAPEGYPNLESVASRLFMSARTLTRQLNERGTNFRQLLLEAQKRDSQTLLRDSRLTLTDIAYRLGYSSLANFARAFRAWNGTSPGEFRGRLNS